MNRGLSQARRRFSEVSAFHTPLPVFTPSIITYGAAAARASFSENRGGKRFDTGFDFETGIAINKIYIGIDYAIGVVDISSLNSLKTNNFTIKAGYYF